MNEDKILTIPSGMDTASMLAMQQNSMFNNPWAYLILLSIFQNLNNKKAGHNCSAYFVL